MHRLIVFIGLLTAVIVSVATWSLTNVTTIASLNDTGENLPIKAVQDKRFFVDAADPTPGEVATGDVDGDGVDELVLCTSRGLICQRPGVPDQAREIPWQHHLGSKFGKYDTVMRFSLCGDVNGDGADEAILTYRVDTDSLWHVHIFDSHTGKANRDFKLPEFEDLDENDYWDGNYYAVGLLENATPTGSPGIILLCEVGYDVYGRGVLILDPDTGNVIWRHDTALNPNIRQTWIGDVDGDGDTDILLAGVSPGNMPDRIIDRCSDSLAAIMHFSHTGEMEWAAPIGAHFFTPFFDVGDVDNDNDLEVVVATRHHSQDHGDTLAVLEGATGTRLAWYAAAENFVGIAIAQTVVEGKRSIYCGSKSGILRHLTYGDGNLELANSIPSEGILDLVSIGNHIALHEGEEIIVGRNDSVYLALDLDFKPLAIFETQFFPDQALHRLIDWRADGHEQIMILFSDLLRQGFYFIKNPIRFPLKLWVTLLISAIVIPLAWKHRYYLRSCFITPGQKRAELMRLNRSLEEQNHNKTDILSDLEFAIAALEDLDDSVEYRSTSSQRISSAVRTFVTNDYPILLESLTGARLINFQPRSVTSALCALEKLVNILDTLDRTQYQQDQISGNYGKLVETFGHLETNLKSVKDALKVRFNTNAITTIYQQLEKNKPRLSEQNIRVNFSVSGLPAPPLMSDQPPKEFDCLIVSPDLSFIVDNLIVNACNAMQNSDAKKLEIKANRAGIDVVIDFIDTGCGIATDRVDSIFSGQDSTSGGGSGLILSRNKLKFWHGRLALVQNSVTVGGHFKLSLRALKVK